MNYDYSDDSDSYTDPNRSLAKFLKNPEVSEPNPNGKLKNIPKINTNNYSSDSYDSFAQKNSSPDKRRSETEKSKNHKNILKNLESSDNDENFTTSQINPDYKILEAQYAKEISSSDEETNKNYNFNRRPPPSSVAYQLRSSSSDDEESKPKPKPKMPSNSKRRFAESVVPKKAKFNLDEPNNNSIKFDDSVSQRNARPMARTVAASVSSSKSSKSKKWSISRVANENPLDIEIEQLIETESKLTAAEQEKLAHDLEFYSNDITSANPTNQNKKKIVQEKNQSQENKDVQTVVERYYARMLKKKFPELIEKKNALHEKRERRHELNFNNNILFWPREMIEKDNQRIQDEINQINKELKRKLKENDELKKQIQQFQQILPNSDDYDYDY